MFHLTHTIEKLSSSHGDLLGGLRNPKSHGDGGVMKHAGVTDWKHVITNLHMCGRKSILTSFFAFTDRGRIGWDFL